MVHTFTVIVYDAWPFYGFHWRTWFLWLLIFCWLWNIVRMQIRNWTCNWNRFSARRSSLSSCSQSWSSTKSLVWHTEENGLHSDYDHGDGDMTRTQTTCTKTYSLSVTTASRRPSNFAITWCDLLTGQKVNLKHLRGCYCQLCDELNTTFIKEAYCYLCQWFKLKPQNY